MPAWAQSWRWIFIIIFFAFNNSGRACVCVWKVYLGGVDPVGAYARSVHKCPIVLSRPLHAPTTIAMA